jgi:hypothetical protein
MIEGIHAAGAAWCPTGTHDYTRRVRAASRMVPIRPQGVWTRARGNSL